ncbi:MAG: phage capsid protein [Acidiferrobacterales bacterium]
MRGLVTVFNHQKKKGDTLHIPNFTRSLANSKAAETAITFNTATHGVTNISLDQHFHYATLMEDIVDIQAMSPLLRQAYSDDAGYAIGRQVDYDMHVLGTGLQGGTLDASPGTPDANTLTYGTGAVIGSDGATAWSPASAGNGTALADAGVRRAMRDLDDQNYPLSQRSWIVPPVTRESLLGIPRFTEQAFQGDGAPIKSGFLGKLYGDEVFVSTECGTTTNTSGTTSYRAVLYIHKSALSLAEQLAPRAQTQYDAEFLGTIFVVDMIYGTAELRNDGGRALIVPA